MTHFGIQTWDGDSCDSDNFREEFPRTEHKHQVNNDNAAMFVVVLLDASDETVCALCNKKRQTAMQRIGLCYGKCG